MDLPVHAGELVTFLAAVNHTGSSSMEIGIKMARQPQPQSAFTMASFSQRQGLTMTLTFVSTRAVRALVLPVAMLIGHAGASHAATAPANAASAPAKSPGLLDRAKTATKNAANATANTISKAGKAVDAKVPRTEAYKKKHAKEAAASAAK